MSLFYVTQFLLDSLFLFHSILVFTALRWNQSGDGEYGRSRRQKIDIIHRVKMCTCVHFSWWKKIVVVWVGRTSCTMEPWNGAHFASITLTRVAQGQWLLRFYYGRSTGKGEKESSTKYLSYISPVEKHCSHRAVRHVCLHQNFTPAFFAYAEEQQRVVTTNRKKETGQE